MDNQKETVNVDKIMLYNFLNTASKKDLQEILSFIDYLKRTDFKEASVEEEIDEDYKEIKLHTQLDVQPILNSFGYLELNHVENRIKEILQGKELTKLTKTTNEKTLDILTGDLTDQQIVAILDELRGFGYTRADVMMGIDFNDIPEDKRTLLPQDWENNQAALQKILSEAAAKGRM